MLNCGLCCPADRIVNWNNAKRGINTLNLLGNKKNKQTMVHESNDYTNCNRCSWYSHQRIGTMTGGHGNNWTGGGCQNYSIVEIGQNTEKSPGDLNELAVTQTIIENYQLTLMWKSLMENNNNNDKLAELWTFPYLWTPEGTSKKKKKWLVLGPCQKIKKIWNIRVTVIPIINGTQETVPKVLVRDWKTWKWN